MTKLVATAQNTWSQGGNPSVDTMQVGRGC